MSEENYTYLFSQHKDASELHITKKHLMGKMKIEMKNESWKLQIKVVFVFKIKYFNENKSVSIRLDQLLESRYFLC